ncbi:hypothetical protein C1646_775136 [Rhizophagus diaphanus]|nr:hypothetical protein C1646_775136 [Rhizophagus diaphanus] [Rhizophagus sp. MUCL 43196]
MPKVLCNKTIKQKHSSYPVHQKNQVITYTKQYEQNKVARHFQLNASMIGRWVTASKSWNTEINQDCKRIGSDDNNIEDFDNEIIDISDNNLEVNIDDLENNISDDNLKDDISCNELDISIIE